MKYFKMIMAYAFTSYKNASLRKENSRQTEERLNFTLTANAVQLSLQPKLIQPLGRVL